MSDAKLKFVFTPPERGTVLPIKMDRDRWFELADKNNIRRAERMQRGWYRFQMEDLWTELYA